MQIQHIQKKFPLIIAIACGIAAILLLNAYIRKKELEIWNKIKQAQAEQQQKQQAQAQSPQQQMGVALVAAKEIPAQTPITADFITFQQIPVEYIQPGIAASLEQIIGQISSVPIAAGEQIIQAKLMAPGKIVKGLAGITPPGKRAVTVTVEDIASVANLLHPGDYVDVLALINIPAGALSQQKEKTSTLLTLFQGVEILAIGEQLISAPGAGSEEKKDKTKISTPQKDKITFALTPKEANLLAFVQEHGKIRVSLRSAEDSNIEQIEPANWETLFKYLSTESEGKAGFAGKPTVEIYRGLQKEVVPLLEKKK